MIRQRIHTGCSCEYCRRGKDRLTRRAFYKKMRRTHKLQLQLYGELIDVDISIGFTD